jgi:hypothetical protein
VYFKSVKARDNPGVERLKGRIQLELRRPLTDQEEYLLELSAALLGSDNEESDFPPPKAA